MATIPALGTDTGAILALSVLGAALIARQLVAQAACPARVAPALAVLAHPVQAAIQAANGCKGEGEEEQRQTLLVQLS